MKDSLLKFDTIVAACALLMSSITAGAMVYQTRVLQDQFSATVWPYLNIETTYNTNSVKIELINDGAGPALIRSAQLLVDGRAVGGWGDVMRIVARDVPAAKGNGLSMQMSSIDASTAIRAAESQPLVTLAAKDPTVFSAVRKHQFGLRFCYCSINDRCWSLNGALGTRKVEVPVAVPSCVVGPSISVPVT